VVVVDEPSGLSTVTVVVPSECDTLVSFVHVPATHGSFTSTTVVVFSFVFVVVHLDKLPVTVHVFDVEPSEAVSVVTVLPLSNDVVQDCLPLVVVHVGPDVIAGATVVVVVVVQ
jgi:hypothetical protein